jgi:hypothetical protein
MDNQTGAQVHNAQSHSSAVEQSEDAAHDVPMAGGVDSAVEVPTMFHNAQSHSSVEQSEDAAHDVPMAGGVGSAVEVPTTNIVGASAAEPFRFGTMAQGLFNWRKRNASTQLNEVRIL